MCEQCNCNSNENLEEQVKTVLEAVRPSLQSHGGDVEFVALEKDNTVKVKLKGACSGCPGARATLKNGIEAMLKEKLPQIKEVVAAE